MKIIGHRGAAGLALENTLPSLELARLLGVDAIEFDVRKTKDNMLVLCHDADLSDVSKSNIKVGRAKLKDLQHVILNDDQSIIPTLGQALQMCGSIPVFIELKDNGCAELLIKELIQSPATNITVVSFKLDELTHLRKLNPSLRLYGLERTKPFDIIQSARELRLDGVGLNFWLLNPLTYWLAKRNQLSIFVYTVNSRLLGRFIGLLYPDVEICTNHPEWFIKHPYLRLRASRPSDQLSGKKRRKQSSYVRNSHK